MSDETKTAPRGKYAVDAKARKEYGDPPGDDPVERLRHTLAVFSDSNDETVVLTATGQVYLDAPWTGLTMADLRALLALVESGGVS